MRWPICGWRNWKSCDRPPMPASRPQEPPPDVVRWGEEERRRKRAFPPSGEAKELKPATTRRMPSDAVADLWLEELEELEA